MGATSLNPAISSPIKGVLAAASCISTGLSGSVVIVVPGGIKTVSPATTERTVPGTRGISTSPLA